MGSRAAARQYVRPLCWPWNTLLLSFIAFWYSPPRDASASPLVTPSALRPESSIPLFVRNLRFRSSSGIFDSALRPESSTGTLRHGMVRGIERTTIFRDDTDRTDFVARLAALAESGALTGYAWAFLPNHAHWLVRTGIRPCSAVCGPSSPATRSLQPPPQTRRPPLPESIQVHRGGGGALPLPAGDGSNGSLLYGSTPPDRQVSKSSGTTNGPKTSGYPPAPSQCSTALSYVPPIGLCAIQTGAFVIDTP